MKRVVRSRSGGREMYGPKWQNLESNSSENGDNHSLSSSPIEKDGIARTSAAPAAVNESDGQALEIIDNVGTTDIAETTAAPTNGQTREGTNRRRIHISNSQASMYRAALEGDIVAVEMLLESDPNLASDEISEEGDRALHVATTFKHQELVEKLVQRMSPSDLMLLDGHGYTACCYAAIAGAVEIADLMMKKNASLATARDRENKTPLYKAAFRGNAKMVSYFLRSVEVGDFPVEEWFALLLVTIRRKMYGVAAEILGSNEQLATMRNDEETALHLLARQRFHLNRRQWRMGEMRQDMRALAKKLMACIQRLPGHESAVEFLKNPSVLHAAAKHGNVELITMLTHTYPCLVWHTDNKGYTMFHIAVKYRQENLFALVDEIGARIDLIAATQDEDGNNILHLAAELGAPDRTVLFPTSVLQREINWFEKVKAVVPSFCREMRNKDGHTPRRLFYNEHRKMMENNRTWTRNTADSWMLISTLLFSLVFASAFAVPGGYNQETGIPLLLSSNWFVCFVIFEALAMFSSALSVFYFSRTMMGSEHEMLESLPNRMKNGLLCLSLSVFGAVSVFMSAYFMVYAENRTAFVTSIIVIVYVVFVSFLLSQNISFRLGLPGVRFRKWSRHSLFKPHDDRVRSPKFLKSLELWIMVYGT